MKRTKTKTAPKPASVTLGLYTILILYKPHVENGTAFGVFDSHELTITLEETLKGHLLVETLLHEIIEAVNFLLELQLKHPKIQTLGLLIAQGILSCPDLTKYISSLKTTPTSTGTTSK